MDIESHDRDVAKLVSDFNLYTKINDIRIENVAAIVKELEKIVVKGNGKESIRDRMVVIDNWISVVKYVVVPILTGVAIIIVTKLISPDTEVRQLRDKIEWLEKTRIPGLWP